MNRTFHHHVSVQGVLAVALMAVVALWCFWERSGISPVLGFVCLMLGAAAVDRLVNSSYTFTNDNILVVEHGRLGKRLQIPVAEIVAARTVRGSLFVARHIVIEYGYGKIAYVQPQQTHDFINEIRRRQSDAERQ